MIKVLICPYFLKIQLELQTKRSKNNTLLFSCLFITNDLLSQLTFYTAAGKMSCWLNRFGLSYLFYVIFGEAITCSFIKFHWNFKCFVPFFVRPFVTGSYPHTKFGCKNISATENRTENVPWSFQSPWPWLWTQQSNLSQVTPDYDDVPSNYIWLQKDRAALNIHSRNDHIGLH